MNEKIEYTSILKLISISALVWFWLTIIQICFPLLSFETNAAAPALTSTTPADNAIDVSPLTNLEMRFDNEIIAGPGSVYVIHSQTSSNVALNKTTRQSSIYADTVVSNRAVDGNTNGDWNQSSVSCTNSEENPWWEVDLGSNYYIDNINLWNRIDGAPSSLSNYWVFVSQTPFGSSDFNSIKSDPTIWKKNIFPYPNPDSSILISAPGRYVRIQLETTEYLTIAEVQVFSSGKIEASFLAEDNSKVNINNKTVVITPGYDMPDRSSYHIIVEANAFKYGTNSYFEGISDQSFWNFTIPKQLQLVSTTPIDNANDVDPTASILMNFNKNISSGTGSIYIVETLTSANVALGKPASQSSIGSGGLPERAVDGNTSELWSSDTITHTRLHVNPWWQVDLGDKYYLDKINIWNRADNCESRLSNYWIFVSDTPFGVADLVTLKADPNIWKVFSISYPNLNTEFPVGASGRYIRVQIEGIQYLHIAEFQAFSKGRVESKILANDVTKVFISNTSVTLKPGYELPDRRDYHILISDTSFKNMTNSYFEGIADSTVWNFSIPKQLALLSTTPVDNAIDVTPSSTFVMNFNKNIFAGTGSVNIVQKLASTNVALSKTVSQSSIGWGGLPERAVDGNTNSLWDSETITHTGEDENPWWQVDLENKYSIDTINIWNRAENCQSRMSNFWIFVSNTPFGSADLNTLKEDTTIWKVNQLSYPNLNSIFNVGTIGRYVRVQIEGSQYLNIAELQVFSTGLVASSISANDEARIAINNATVTITPASPIPNGYEYNVIVTNTAFKKNDTCYFEGITDPSVWNFTISSQLQLITTAPVDDATNINTDVSPIITFNKNIVAGTGNMYVIRSLLSTNVALGKTASESSIYEDSVVASRAVDGNTSGIWGESSLSCTNAESNPWWQVDLGSNYYINNINVWNITDSTPARLSNYWIFVSQNPFEGTATIASLKDDETVWKQKYFAVPSPSSLSAIGTVGRYVRVQLEKTEYLTIAEVEVFSDGIVEKTFLANDNTIATFTDKNVTINTGLTLIGGQEYKLAITDSAIKTADGSTYVGTNGNNISFITKAKVWVDDYIPALGVPNSSGGDSWTWDINPTPQSGVSTHSSANKAAFHQHYFEDSKNTLFVPVGATLFTYIYLDPTNTPQQIMLQFKEGTSWEHRAFWGSNSIAVGSQSGVSDDSRLIGALPPKGEWVKLEVPASLVGLEGKTLTGVSYGLYNGAASWDMTDLFGIPTISTNMDATDITYKSAVVGGTIVSDCGSPITERGIVYSLTPFPTITGDKVISAGIDEVFTLNLSNLSHNKMYYFRAYATNSYGTAYGQSSTFTTLNYISMVGLSHQLRTGNDNTFIVGDIVPLVIKFTTKKDIVNPVISVNLNLLKANGDNSNFILTRVYDNPLNITDKKLQIKILKQGTVAPLAFTEFGDTNTLKLRIIGSFAQDSEITLNYNMRLAPTEAVLQSSVRKYLIDNALHNVSLGIVYSIDSWLYNNVPEGPYNAQTTGSDLEFKTSVKIVNPILME